jgi:molybdate transport system ATP-binding protein
MALEVNLRRKLEYIDIDVSFSCEEDSLTVLIGPSGGGKSSIIRMISGLDRPDAGSVRFNGQTWYDSASRIFLPPQKRRLGYVFQDYTLFPHLNLYENVTFAAVDKKEAEMLMEFFGIGHLRGQKPDKVSGGERQRCAICQALARKPQLLLLDEPFSALDVITRRILREEMKRLKENLSIPFIYVTHDIGGALFLADQILPIVGGKLDKGWMQRTITREPSAGVSPRATRAPRLSLVY